MTTWLTDGSGEEWRPVREFDGSYEVSNFGRVRSLDRRNDNSVGVSRFLRGKILSLSQDSEGYAQVGLLRDGAETKARVHRLVGAAFLDNPLNLPIIDHRDRNRRNNVPANLRWASFSDNRRNTGTIADMKRLAEGDAPGLGLK